MAERSFQVITALRNTADRIQKSTLYQWGHMGLCNCGFLVQEISQLNKDQIHARAMEKCGDWNEQLNDYCPTSGLLMDNLISSMLAFGFDSDDLKHLEKLDDPAILHALPHDERNLKHNVKSDVVKYLKTWASMIETDLLADVEVPDLISLADPMVNAGAHNPLAYYPD